MAAARKIFINYRRDDSRADAGRLYDRLHARYPDRVFRDVGSLEPGVEWHEAIDRVLGSSDACIVVIGPHWLDVTDANGKRRIDDPRDTVRKEVSTALKSGMRVFPVLVGGAKMPAEESLPEELQALARRNALELSEQDFDEAVDKLAKAIERTLGWTPKAKASTLSPRTAGVVAVAVIIVFAVTYGLVRNSSSSATTSNDATGSSLGSGSNVVSPTSDVKSSGVNSVRQSVPEAPPPTPRRPTEVVGAWRAVVTAEGQEINLQLVRR